MHSKCQKKKNETEKIFVLIMASNSLELMTETKPQVQVAQEQEAQYGNT